MPTLQMPGTREFGWTLRSPGCSHFNIQRRPNGQFSVVLNHALLRGVSSEMLHWWFLNFPNLRVKLIDVPGYEDSTVPAYLLWHPIDHYNATLSGALGPGRTARPGAFIHIQEAMQYDRFGWTYPVDTKVRIFYVGRDGWAMGRRLPVLGPVMMLRIHFQDVYEAGRPIGVHYHYEVVIGASAGHALARLVNKKICSHCGPEFFDAWHRHNVIEVGVLENFLAPLYAQRDTADRLVYKSDMDPLADLPLPDSGYSRSLFDTRVAGYASARDPYDYQAFADKSIVPEQHDDV